jgi:hypothetical protein
MAWHKSIYSDFKYKTKFNTLNNTKDTRAIQIKMFYFNKTESHDIYQCSNLSKIRICILFYSILFYSILLYSIHVLLARFRFHFLADFSALPDFALDFPCRSPCPWLASFVSLPNLTSFDLSVGSGPLPCCSFQLSFSWSTFFWYDLRSNGPKIRVPGNQRPIKYQRDSTNVPDSSVVTKSLTWSVRLFRISRLSLAYFSSRY